jgi:hypothetical protein
MQRTVYRKSYMTLSRNGWTLFEPHPHSPLASQVLVADWDKEEVPWRDEVEEAVEEEVGVSWVAPLT